MIDFQAVVVGSLINQPSLLAECDLSSKEFYTENYALIYQAVLDIEASQEPVDVLTVAEKVGKSTGRNYLQIVGNLVQDYSLARTARSIKSYVDQVRNANRDIVAKRIGKELTEGLEIDTAIKELMALNETRRTYECSLTDGVNLAVSEIDYLSQHPGEMGGVSTGLQKLNEALGGFRAPDLYIIAARTSIGKTSLLVNLILNANVHVGFISTEQPRNQIGMRSIAATGRVSLHAMRTGKMEDADWPKITSALEQLKDKNVRIYDDASVHINDIIRQARKWKQLYNIEALYIDYLQRIENDNKLDKKKQVDDITIKLKNIARELNIPVISLAQVNRECESRPNKRPRLSDIADSSGIEKEADNVMLLYRDEVYNPETTEPNVMEINVTKNRHGPTGMIKTIWFGKFTRVENFAPQYGP